MAYERWICCGCSSAAIRSTSGGASFIVGRDTSERACTRSRTARPARASALAQDERGNVGRVLAGSSGKLFSGAHLAFPLKVCGHHVRSEQPAPPYVPYYVPHGPHEVRRAVLAGREARADPGGAPARTCVLSAHDVSRKGASCPSCRARAAGRRSSSHKRTLHCDMHALLSKRSPAGRDVEAGNLSLSGGL